VPKIISECCELVKLCDINCSGPVFWRHTVVFPQQTLWQYSDGISPDGSVECMRCQKSQVSTKYLALSQKWYKILQLLWNANRTRMTVCGLSNGGIFNDFEWPLTHISRSRHYFTLNISNGTRYRHKLECNTNSYLYVLLKTVTSNDLERLSEICNDMKRARLLCDSWASCFVNNQSSDLIVASIHRVRYWVCCFEIDVSGCTWATTPVLADPQRNGLPRGSVLLHHTVWKSRTQWRSRLNACVRVNGGHFKHKFWASDFLLCFVCFIDTGFCKCDRYKHVQSANIGVKCVTFVSKTFTLYGSNITIVWQGIFTPMTLAFSCEVVREKL